MRMKDYEIDWKRTQELNLPELQVIAGKGDKEHFYCILSSSNERQVCPRCGLRILRNQGLMQRELYDIIRRNGDASVITLTIEYQKNKCLSPGCGCVFYPEMPFASAYSRATHRYEDVLIRLILRGGWSYTQASNMLGGKLSKQVVGKTLYRRVRELESEASGTPEWFRKLMDDDPDYHLREILIRLHHEP